MNTPLIELAANELLKKFGAGSHKPGSGSAAAFQGLLFAKLVITVSQLTLQRGVAYQPFFGDCKSAIADIDGRISPRLEELFQNDSVIFDRVIKLRNERKVATSSSERNRLSQEEHDALVPATEIPVEIAELCVEIAHYAAFNFQHGFKAARGDSGVALHGATAAIAGCLNIIDVNLLSYCKDGTWSNSVRDRTNVLRTMVGELQTHAAELSAELTAEFEQKIKFNLGLDALRRYKTGVRSTRIEEIEELARDLQNLMWVNRDLMWRDKTWDTDDPREHLAILKPQKALRALGYQVHDDKPLGSHQSGGRSFDIAGIINNAKKEVHISSEFPTETRLFTAAHELGHALLHDHSVMHRDRPVDGSNSGVQRDKTELQADTFAACFLMPRTKVIELFRLFFKCDRVTINETTALGFGVHTTNALRAQCPQQRDLSRKLAAVGKYAGIPFQPLHKLFSVSIETMAIRLEELGLV